MEVLLRAGDDCRVQDMRTTISPDEDNEIITVFKQMATEKHPLVSIMKQSRLQVGTPYGHFHAERGAHIQREGCRRAAVQVGHDLPDFVPGPTVSCDKDPGACLLSFAMRALLVSEGLDSQQEAQPPFPRECVHAPPCAHQPPTRKDSRVPGQRAPMGHQDDPRRPRGVAKDDDDEEEEEQEVRRGSEERATPRPWVQRRRRPGRRRWRQR